MKKEVMKTPEIKGWDCIDHDPIEEWVPDDPSDVEFWCNIAIGLSGENGADNFQVHIATNKALSRIEDKKYMVVVPYYESWVQVLDVLHSIVAECEDIGWSGMSEQLAKHFHWEYEGVR
ncbi:Imm8 family immunity protein [Microbulbifer sp. PAAF003]|uniref:Imm8 family immunity protein n=1 Tax=Microbulbifer sp. PAAF003 TaxID=3243375 RepID=UPI004039B5B3